jgi:Spy/CpxP family protein refolding chaperone
MKRTAAVVAGLAVVGLLLLSGFYWGGGHGRWGGVRMARVVTAHLDNALDDLEATDAQRTQVHALKDRVLTGADGLRAGHGQARDELLAQWKQPAPDAARVHAVVDGRVDALRAFAHQAADAALELHRILTPEQRAELTERAERFK